MQYTCLVFGEGRKDKKILIALIDLDKFQYHTKKWFCSYDNGSGGSPETILEQCRKSSYKKSYDLIMCFIDLDKLKNDYPHIWRKKQKELEEKYLKRSNIMIIWQIDNAEDEYKKVLGGLYLNKHKLNQLAQQKINKFINSDFWHRILKPLKDKEKKLKEVGEKNN